MQPSLFHTLVFCTSYLIAKLVPVGYGIMKLQISCVVEDDKVGTEFLEEEICNFDDLVSYDDFIGLIYHNYIYRFKV